MNEKYIRKIIRESLNELDEARMTTNSMELISKMLRGTEGVKILDIRSMFDGMTGLFRYEKDGNAYEIQIKPASSIRDKEFWGNKLVSKEHPNKKMFRDLGINKP